MCVRVECLRTCIHRGECAYMLWTSAYYYIILEKMINIYVLIRSNTKIICSVL